MSTLHKDFDHALCRMGTYLMGQTGHDKLTNVKAYLYKETLKLEENPEHFDIRVKKNACHFDVSSYLNRGTVAFPDEVKLGDKFGPSYST